MKGLLDFSVATRTVSVNLELLPMMLRIQDLLACPIQSVMVILSALVKACKIRFSLGVSAIMVKRSQNLLREVVGRLDVGTPHQSLLGSCEIAALTHGSLRGTFACLAWQ